MIIEFGWCLVVFGNLPFRRFQSYEVVSQILTYYSIPNTHFLMHHPNMNKMDQLNVNIQDQLPPISPPCRSSLVDGNVPAARYTKLAEVILKTTNSQLQCSMFCGGRKCKYESSKTWSDQDKAISTIYSHWITDDILAMSRPNTEMIECCKLIEMFKSNNINTVINLQEQGEHGNCGPPLNKSGFTYDPKVFMDNQIYFYNFQWKDYSAVSVNVLLDMVKVVSFALNQGKIAVHCHAGLGRTGVLIAAYLIFTYRCQAQSAIQFVRKRRPNSIQSRSQILCLFKFANFISPGFIVYSGVSSSPIKVTLADFLHRQNILLHGEERRCLRYIPKIVFVICEKLLILAGKQSSSKTMDGKEDNFTRNYLSSKNYETTQDMNKSPLSINPQQTTHDHHDQSLPNKEEILKFTFGDSNNEHFSEDKIELERNNSLEIEGKYSNLIDSLVKLDTDEAIADDNLNPETLCKHRPSFDILHGSLLHGKDLGNKMILPIHIISKLLSPSKNDPTFNSRIYSLQKEINNKPIGWDNLCNENDVDILVVLLLTWFKSFDIPIINGEIIELIGNNKDSPLKCFFQMEQGTRYTLEYLIRFILTLTEDQTKECKDRLIARFLASLSIKRITLPNGETFPMENTNWSQLETSADILFAFIQKLEKLILK